MSIQQQCVTQTITYIRDNEVQYRTIMYINILVKYYFICFQNLRFDNQ